MTRWDRRLRRAATVVVVATVAVVAAATTSTFGSLAATVTNTGTSARTAVLAYTHTYQARTCTSVGSGSTAIACAGSIGPTTAVPATGSVAGTDSITQASTLPSTQITDQVQAASCGPVQLVDSDTGANPLTTQNPMLPRYSAEPSALTGATGPFAGTDATVFDGSTGYATDVLSQTQPTPTSTNQSTYGVGLWFKAAAGISGPLFSFSGSAVNGTGTSVPYDRELELTTAGQLSFVENTAGTLTTTTSASSYANGAWHYAYVTYGATTVAGIWLGTTTTIYVDGAQAGSNGQLFTAPYTADTGWWHLGFGVFNSAAAYFAGSLADFGVWNNGAVAAPTSTQLATSTAFTAWETGTTNLWPLGDSGTVTFAGPLPVIGTTSPCTQVNLSWGFANPTSCAAAPASATAACSTTATLAAFATGTWVTIATPTTAQTQVSTIALSRATGYSTAEVPGLHLYVPLAFRALNTATQTWSLTFTWADASTPFVA